MKRVNPVSCTLRALFGVTAAAGTTQGAAPKVLVLNDGANGPTVVSALNSAGINATAGPNYYDWDGSNPTVGQFDSVVYLDGHVYGQGLGANTAGGKAFPDSLIAGYVGTGAGLIRTEWSAYYKGINTLTDQLMPVSYTSGYTNNATWKLTNATHPLTASLPASWTDPGYYSNVSLVPNGVAVVELANAPIPLVSYRNNTNGVVVHINNALSYAGTGMSPQLIQLLVNAVRFATPLHMEAVSSVRNHGPAGAFHLVLPTPYNNNVVEPRQNGTNPAMHLTFDGPFEAEDGLADCGDEVIVTNGTCQSLAIEGNTLKVYTTFNNNSCVALQLSGLRRVGGGGPIRFDHTVNVLAQVGNVNGQGSTNILDLQQIKNNLNRPVSETNFLTDVNVNGSINILDLQAAKNNLNQFAELCF